HFHADHPVFSCSKSEQKQLNTWVSFQSAEEPLLGQFSVSGNNYLLSSCEPRLQASAFRMVERLCKCEVATQTRARPDWTVGLFPFQPGHRLQFAP
ncbi:hypothetical protein, partial [Pseudomonas viridiflava]